MNRRLLLIGGGIAVLIILFIIVVGFSSQNSSPQSTTFTNSITGQQQADNPSEIGDSQYPTGGNAPFASITGFDQLDKILTQDESDTLQTTLTNFLLAHSGLQTVHAGIKNSQLNQVGDGTYQFELDVVQPQLTYQVTVVLDTTNNAVQGVDFKQVE